jgi:hypothetical protein
MEPQERTLPLQSFTKNQVVETKFTVCFKESNTKILVFPVVILRLIYSTPQHPAGLHPKQMTTMVTHTQLPAFSSVDNGVTLKVICRLT